VTLIGRDLSVLVVGITSMWQVSMDGQQLEDVNKVKDVGWIIYMSHDEFSVSQSLRSQDTPVLVYLKITSPANSEQPKAFPNVMLPA
jgi:hypothetical protein